MLHIGCHLSSSKGYMAMGNEALELDADTFAFFTRNPRGGTAKPLDVPDAESFCSFADQHHFAPLVAHAPYTLNPCAADPHLREYAYQTMLDDLFRLTHTPGNFYNFHPGSHVQQGADVGIQLTSDLLARAVAAEQGFVQGSPFVAGSKVRTVLLVETMAGKGSEIGRTFEEVHAILEQAEEKYLKIVTDAALHGSGSTAVSFADTAGVCLDTCHVWDGGYDIVNDLDGVITRFDKTVGLSRLHAVHLNDSMNPLGAHKDRHQKIGQGCIGLDALVRVIHHPALKNLPFILETPNEHDGYKAEIALLRSKSE